MYDVTALGELLIDFSPSGKSQGGSNIFEQNPGGAPANVLAVLAKFGRRTAFIGKLGNDRFGIFLKGVLDGLDIDTEGLVFTDKVNTSLAFVHLDENGDRSFNFYRNPGADMMLDKNEVRYDLIKKSRIFHFGSVSMTHEPCRSATFEAVNFARKNNLLISYDPNLRPLLWENLEQAKEVISQGMKCADILKFNEEELVFLTDQSDMHAGTGYIYDKYGTQLIFVTLGPKGCFYRMNEDTGYIPGINVRAIDTTGAGDAFLGSILYKIVESKKDLRLLTAAEVDGMAAFANIFAAMVTTKKGAIPAIPAKGEINGV